MKLAIMQPYFFPYIGYFQLMKAVDEFVVYDNIEYSKGWVNRNRILVNGKDVYLTLPLKKDSDYLPIVGRFLSEAWGDEKIKLLNRIRESYRKAPYFKNVFPLIEQCLNYDERNLFKFLFNSLIQVKSYLGVSTPVVISSSISIDHSLKAEEKVLVLCKDRKTAVYINPIGGVEIYSKERFRQHGIELLFLKADDIRYTQFANEFVPFLSIIDVMMFNAQQKIQEHLLNYTLF